MLRSLFKGESSARTALLKALPKHGIGVEIGVWKGDFSELLLRTTKPKTLYLVDPWLASSDEDRSSEALYGADKIDQKQMDDIHRSVRQRFSAGIENGQVVVSRSSSGEQMKKLGLGSVDYVYIDGDHSYDGVSTDLALAFDVTRVGGYICCDDYMLGYWWKDGVVRAVHEFLAAFPVVLHSKSDSQVIMKKMKPSRVDISAPMQPLA